VLSGLCSIWKGNNLHICNVSSRIISALQRQKGLVDMSMLTAEDRKKARDHKLDGVNRTLRNDRSLQGLSLYQRGTLAELKLIGRYLYADMSSAAA
jgi:hypothetical protein